METRTGGSESSLPAAGPQVQPNGPGRTELDGIRQKVFLDRYSLKDRQGHPLEQYPEQVWQRVARGIAEVEATPEKREQWERRFYDLMRDFRFVPGGRILAGAGTGHAVTFYNCYVIPSPEDSRGGILDNLKVMTEIMARGGGVGVNLSTLRPRGSYIRTVNGTASGPCSWAELYSVATGDVIQQGGSRRGALMLMLDDSHPDIEEFITVKRDHRRITHANLSVCVSDAFMDAVRADGDWQLRWNGEVKKVVKARYIWDLICSSAWESAEPGVVFIDRYNKQSNTWYYEKIISVNPCGEQGLPEWGVCNLGAVNLSEFVTAGRLDQEALADTVKVAIRFLDNVIDANEYFIEANRQGQLGTRRTGLGTMGLADALIKLKVRYGSDESLRVIDTIYRVIRDSAYEASVELAIEKGPFRSFDPEKYPLGQFVTRLPVAIQDRIRQHGVRNAVILTQAPTGTTSLLAGVSSGIEPVFDFVMRRRDRTGEHVLYHPLFGEWREQHAKDAVPDYFVSASQLTPEEHVRVQAKIQEYTDSSISKTVNAPNNHTVEDVKRLYSLAYDLGCKGITYFRDGSREGVLSHVDEEKPRKEQAALPSKTEDAPAQLRPRPHVLTGKTYRVKTPVGTAFVTINSDYEHNPFEVFVTVGKAGSDIRADADAIGRLISLALRIPSAYSPRGVAEAIVDQLAGIGGSTSVGFGSQRVRSLPDAVARVVAEHIGSAVSQPPANGNGGNGASSGATYEQQETNPGGAPEWATGSAQSAGAAAPVDNPKLTGDFCPSCGQLALVYEEGCRKCYLCGFSNC